MKYLIVVLFSYYRRKKIYAALTLPWRWIQNICFNINYSFNFYCLFHIVCFIFSGAKHSNFSKGAKISSNEGDKAILNFNPRFLFFDPFSNQIWSDLFEDPESRQIRSEIVLIWSIVKYFKRRGKMKKRRVWGTKPKKGAEGAPPY